MDRADIKLIVGKTGSGKTVKCLNLTRDIERVIYFDTQNKDYTDGVAFYDMSELSRFWLKVYKQKFRLIYRPVDPMNEFDEICRLAFTCGNLTIVAEELPSLCGSQVIGAELRKVIFRGRAHDIHFIGMMNRPIGIHRDITSQATEIFVFNIDEPRDLKYFQERIGQDIEQKVRSLGQYQYLHWLEGAEQIEVGKDEVY
jgi:hypothetical protein